MERMERSQTPGNMLCLASGWKGQGDSWTPKQARLKKLYTCTAQRLEERKLQNRHPLGKSFGIQLIFSFNEFVVKWALTEVMTLCNLRTWEFWAGPRNTSHRRF